MNTPADFPERVKRLRQASKLSQKAFAARLDISRGLLNGLETGRVEPSRWIVQQVNMLERTGVDLLDTPTGEVREESPAGNATERLVAEIKSYVQECIAAAGGHQARLGWIREQLRVHLTPPAHWNLGDEDYGPDELTPAHQEAIRQVLLEEKAAKKRKTS